MPIFDVHFEVGLEFDVDAEVEFEVFCGRCGKGLCNVSETGKTKGSGMHYVNVQPCWNCEEMAEYKGYKRAVAEKEGLNGAQE